MDTKKYNSAQVPQYKEICEKLMSVINQELKMAENKIWHGSPVWFLDGNPVVGYSVRKAGVQLLFWSGQSFKGGGLVPEGSFKAAQVVFVSLKDIKVTALRDWLKQAKHIQWDYKNIVKNKGELRRINIQK